MSQPEIYLHPTVRRGYSVMSVINALQQHLTQPENGQGYIHRVRVDIKRLRGWLRMHRCKFGDDDWKTTDRKLRSIAKKLSARRDSQVLVETLRWLEKKSKREYEKQAIEVIRAHIQFDLGRHPLDWKKVKEPLLSELNAIRRQAFLTDSDHIVIKGLKKTFKCSLKHGDKAFSSKDSCDELHELRKWVKYLYYQLGFIQAVYPDAYVSERKYLNELGDQLGRIHDLNLLVQKLTTLSPEPECIDSVSIVQKMIDNRLKKLINKAERLYKKVFTQSPSRFIHCIT